MTKKCPVCGKSKNLEAAPFCSSRCKQEDLYRWLDGQYRIPTNEAPTDINEGEENEGSGA